MRRPLLFLLALGAIAVLAAGCSGNSSNRGRLTLGASTDTGSASSSSTSDPAFSDSSGSTDLGNFFGDTSGTGTTAGSSDTGSALLGGSDLRKIFISSCEKSGGTTTLCECIADKLDFNNPKNFGKNTIKAARECRKGD